MASYLPCRLYRADGMALIPQSRRSQLEMLVWSLAAFAASMLLVARYSPGELIIAAINPFGYVLVIALAFFLYRFLPNLVMRPALTMERFRAFFQKYGPGLKQTWRGLVACMLLFGTALNLLGLLFDVL
jgi:hypothetical protein